MRRTFNFLLLFFLSVMTVMAAPGDLQEKLAALKGISGIEKLQSDYYPEKYVVRITQQVDPKDPAAGTFTQRVIVGHVGYDRPTIIVTEGYGAAYALNPKYQEELSKLLKFRISPNEVMESVYNRPFPNRFLSIIANGKLIFPCEFLCFIITHNIALILLNNACV